MSETVSTGAGSIDRSRVINQLRVVGKLEGISYLILLGVAMPLKYLADMPLAVRIAGSAHGGLFILLMIFLGLAWRRAPLSLRQVLSVFIASLLPFGPFVIDRRLEREAAARG